MRFGAGLFNRAGQRTDDFIDAFAGDARHDEDFFARSLLEGRLFALQRRLGDRVALVQRQNLGLSFEYLAIGGELAADGAVGANDFGLCAVDQMQDGACALGVAKNGVAFPLLSDFANRKVAAAYGVLIEQAGMANRATFVVDKEGKITYIEEGNSAIDPTGATEACSRADHKGQ